MAEACLSRFVAGIASVSIRSGRKAGHVYERLYGAWFGSVVVQDAQAAVERSAERYIRAINPNLEGSEATGQ